jgi:V8-like Glu-specific endopeptidase
MRKFLTISFAVIILVASSAGAAWASGAFAAYDIPSDQKEAAARYWTPGKMKNAKPHPIPHKPAAVRGAVKEILEQPTGVAGYYPGYDPEPMANQSGDNPPNDRVGASGSPTGSANGYDYPPPQETFFVMTSNYGTASTPYPYKAIGKVFFTDDEGEDSECSAASIGGRAVLTAGHCICNEEGTYYTNWIFVPAYQEGKEPFGKWTASSFLTFSSYFQGGDMARDVAFAIVEDHGGVKLSHKVGNLGFAYNQSKILHWSMFGYPAESPWTGEVMVETEASYATVDTAETPNTTGIGTTQTGGCSGGPWITNFAPGLNETNKNLANGVNSYTLGDEDLLIYAPYFDGGDTGVQGLYEQAIAK